MPTLRRFFSTAPPSQPLKPVKSPSEFPSMSKRGAMGGGARVLVFLLAFVLLAGTAAPDAFVDKCAKDVYQLQDCQAYGSNTTETPGDKCCNAAKNVNNTNRFCLCYIIQEVYKENPLVKSVNLQGPRLLQLPKSCNFTDTSVSDCIRLLDIRPGAPENGIFNGSGVYNKSDGGGNPGGDGFAIRARYSYAFASAVLSAVALSVFSN